MVRIAHGFTLGFFAPLRAAGAILTTPALLLLAAVPLAINIGLYILFFRYGADGLEAWINQTLHSFTGGYPAWAVSVSHFILKILGWLLLLLTAMLTFTLVSGLVSAPFNDALSRAAIRRHRKKFSTSPKEPGEEPRKGPSIPQTIGLELRRMIVLIVGGVFAFAMGLIPMLQLPALFLGALLVSFEYFGYPISHHSSRLSTVAGFTLRHPMVSLGFGTFLLLIMAVPFASAIYIPLAVVGGSTVYADLLLLDSKKPGASGNVDKKNQLS
jgi:uncharacterized protein involved in cysteine biosynthesis